MEQHKDAVVAAVIEYLTTGTLPPDNMAGARRLVARSSELALVDGVLYHLGRKCSIPNRQAVMPKDLRAELLQQMHGGLMADYFSGPQSYHSLSCSCGGMACTRMQWNLPTSVWSVPYQALDPYQVVPLSNQSQGRDPFRSGILTSWKCLSPKSAIVMWWFCKICSRSGPKSFQHLTKRVHGL